MIDFPQEEGFGAGMWQTGFWRRDAASGQVFGARMLWAGFWRGDAAGGQVFNASLAYRN